MERYCFTEDCIIGVNEIDQEHKTLFMLINEAFEMLEKPDIAAELVKSVVFNLKKYAEEHFAHEEAYMVQIGDPELERQKKEHKKFKERIEAIDLDEITLENGAENMEQLLVFLSKWLYGHILGSDIMIGQFQGKQEEDLFAFTDKYKTGIAIVDEEHKELFSIIRKTDKVIHADLLHDRYDEIISIIQRLKDYTVQHFSDEEAYMAGIGYEGLEAQKSAHQAFVDKLNEIDLFQLDDSQQEYLEELIDFLLGWLTTHILKMDKKIPVM